ERRGKPTDTVQIQAASSHTVTALNVRAGQYVQPGTHLMTLAQLDRLWLLAEVEEAHIDRVQVGQSVTVQAAAFPGARWKAEVERLGSGLDPTTRTLTARIVIDNADGRLRPEMFVRADIAMPASEAVLSVPASSVIRDGHVDRVIKALGDGRFEVAKVALGQRVGDRWEIREGLAAEDAVVIQGQFLLDTEADIAAEALRLSAPDSDSAAAVHEQHDAALDAHVEHSMHHEMHDPGSAAPDHASHAHPGDGGRPSSENHHHAHGEHGNAHAEAHP
ncbi:MAG: efflux RND transporter periplasmic adaptor subunit, partial [Algiphilus sp.]